MYLFHSTSLQLNFFLVKLYIEKNTFLCFLLVSRFFRLKVFFKFIGKFVKNSHAFMSKAPCVPLRISAAAQFPDTGPHDLKRSGIPEFLPRFLHIPDQRLLFQAVIFYFFSDLPYLLPGSDIPFLPVLFQSDPESPRFPPPRYENESRL